MLSEACLRFREEFRLGDPDDHASRCAPCTEWAREVASLHTAGADLPIPAALRVRILMPNGRAAAPGSTAALEPLPQIPLPSELMARLYRIPAEARAAGTRNHPPAGSGEMVAASLLFAILLTFGLGSFLAPGDRPNFGAASRIAGSVLMEVGNRGTRTLLGVGEGIFDGCIEASRTLESLLGQRGDTKRDPRTDTGDAEAIPPPPTTQRKENTHGSRPAH